MSSASGDIVIAARVGLDSASRSCEQAWSPRPLVLATARDDDPSMVKRLGGGQFFKPRPIVLAPIPVARTTARYRITGRLASVSAKSAWLARPGAGTRAA